jgi:DNA-binding transcriptional LysR family regulator
MMELRHLLYFVAVAEERHFSRASAMLHVTQSTLSAQVQPLEREVGGRLLPHQPTRRADRGR